MDFHWSLISFRWSLFSYHRSLFFFHRSLFSFHQSLISFHRYLFSFHFIHQTFSATKKSQNCVQFDFAKLQLAPHYSFLIKYHLQPPLAKYCYLFPISYSLFFFSFFWEVFSLGLAKLSPKVLQIGQFNLDFYYNFSY